MSSSKSACAFTSVYLGDQLVAAERVRSTSVEQIVRATTAMGFRCLDLDARQPKRLVDLINARCESGGLVGEHGPRGGRSPGRSLEAQPAPSW